MGFSPFKLYRKIHKKANNVRFEASKLLCRHSPVLQHAAVLRMKVKFSRFHCSSVIRIKRLS